MLDSAYLFVYGTLKATANGRLPALLGPGARCLGPARFRGRLYRVADYPGAVASDDPADVVHGELMQLADAAAAWPALDDWEDCAAGLYRRVQAGIDTDAGPRRAWLYLYARPIAGLQRIVSGRWPAER